VSSSSSELPSLSSLPPRADSIDVDLARARTRAAMFGEAPAVARWGRYELGARVGEGAMGSVYSARDTLLGRRVAIKLVHTDGMGEGAIRQMERRVLREARSLARIADPNVVPVFEVGRVPVSAQGIDRAAARSVFLVMAFVEGTTVRQWASRRARTWREVLDVMLAAGRGLAAAHRAGVIHRDFKPDNVMVADDGRVLVTDFGLAHPVSSVTPQLDASASGSLRAGVAVGTVPYMAPECFSGDDVDERADQFAYCVSLFELIAGRRPFVGKNAVEIAVQIHTAEPATLPLGAGAPDALRRVIARGLAKAPEERHHGMDELLHELARVASPRRRRRTIATIAACVVAVAAWSLAPRAAEDCPVDAVAARWNAAEQESLAAAFAATDVPYANDAWLSVRADVDGWARAWSDAHAALCASASAGVPAEVVLARRECLTRAYDELDAMLGVFAAADADVVAKAPGASEQLGDPHRCESASPDASGRAAASSATPGLEAELQRIDALLDLGRYREANEAIERSLREAMAGDDDSLLARAFLLRGAARYHLGALAGAREDLEQAYWIASERDLPAIAADAARRLVGVIQYDGGDLGEIMLWARHAAAEGAAGGLTTVFHCELLAQIGWVHYQRGTFAEALVYTHAALLLSYVTPSCASGRCVRTANLLGNLGRILTQLGREDGGRLLLEQGLALEIARLGADHPDVASGHTGIADLLHRAGRLDDARTHLQRALEIRERSLGGEHFETMIPLNALALLEGDMGNFAAAQAAMERAAAIVEKSRGPDAPELGVVLSNLGNLHSKRGDPYGDLELQRRAVAILGASVPDHVMYAATLSNFGVALVTVRQLAEGEAVLRAAIAARERATGPSDAELAISLVTLGKMLHDSRRFEEAVATLERARGLVGETPGDYRAGRVDFELGRAHWAMGQRERAVWLVERARERLAAAESDNGWLLASTDQWLAEHATVATAVSRRRARRP
jgi:tetratricopeptide (TPR) repeat protein